LKRKQKTTETIDLVPKTGQQYDRMRRVLDALSFKRRHRKASMSYAAKRAGTTLKTVLKYAPSAIEVRSGRYDATPTDRIPRTLKFLTAKGEEDVTVRNSRDATRLSTYQHAVRRAVATFGEDLSKLQRFDKKALRAGGKVYPFVTDWPTIDRLARAGAIHFLDLYPTGGGLS
jgi:hypothetical protein